MNALANLPFWGQLLIIFLFGTILGGQLNRGIYRWAVRKRSISPWSPLPEKGPTRRWYDRIPVLGWMGLRRESMLHGPGHWVRPLVIEALTGAGLAALFWWEISGKLVPPGGIVPPMPVLCGTFVSHGVLLASMIMATFIDLDEKTIPDAVTIPGTIVGLCLASIMPTSLLPDAVKVLPFQFVNLTTPSPWPDWLQGGWGLVIGLACFLGWCYAILPKIWWTRRGIAKALVYMLASIPRYTMSRTVFIIALAGVGAVTGMWVVSGLRWDGVLTSLVGMAFGGGLIWAVRIIGSSALGREAMGFGDVTLMAMIGAFVGWQAVLIIFFLAPLAGLVLAVGQWMLTGRKDIPYGPFLCAATLLVIVAWASIWGDYCREVFHLGWWVPVLVAACLGLMHGMLTVWRFVASALFRS